MKFTSGVLLVAALTASACTSEPPEAPVPDCSPMLPAGSSATQGPEGSAVCTEGPAVAISVEADLALDGFRTVGKAIAFRGGGPFPHGVDAVVPFQSGEASGGRDTELVVLVKRRNAPVHVGAVSNVYVERGLGRLHFHVPDANATFQAALPLGAGEKKTRRWTFRAIAGPSMGGFGSSVNFWRHPDRYDAIGVLGADPGPDLTYSLGMISDWFLGGFCTAQDGAGMIGKLCPPKRQPILEQFERGSTFESFLYESGSGTGLTLRRNLYVRANRDLARALGNGAYHNPDSPYLPPGVPAARVAETPSQFCNNPTVLKGFYDYRFNPDGAFDVITFCDGNDSDQVGPGKFDPAVPATNPVQVLLAVDVNGNGKRDSGEPVVVQASEPFRDLGPDGLASADEPGYDPASNPDPAGDDYHYLWNPAGTEGNWRYDAGEPFDDLGVDGVARATGGCPIGSAPGCFDYGEGNGTFDYVPWQLNWRDHDPRGRVEKLPLEELRRVDIYYDSGIRDFFNAQVSTNSLIGALTGRGVGLRVYEGFPLLVGRGPGEERGFDFNDLDFNRFSKNLYVRYGNPDATEAQIQMGDGRHVGTADQVIHRIQTMLYWMSQRWPGGDRRIAPVDSLKSKINGVLMTKEGREYPYTVVLPPGYFQAENAELRYPVVYLGHGYGQQPVDLAQVSFVAQNAMIDDRVEELRRMQKFIIVLADASCRPSGDVKNEPVDPRGDLCEEGAFYTNHPEGPYQGESQLIQLQEEIERLYRVRAPAEL